MEILFVYTIFLRKRITSILFSELFFCLHVLQIITNWEPSKHIYFDIVISWCDIPKSSNNKGTELISCLFFLTCWLQKAFTINVQKTLIAQMELWVDVFFFTDYWVLKMVFSVIPWLSFILQTFFSVISTYIFFSSQNR